MNRNRERWVRAVIAGALLVPLLVGMTGCWLFNLPPIAAFTVSSQTGQAPFAVNFSAVLSEDEDGIIVTFEWDFGDGTSGSGENVTHTYTEAGTYTVVLRVTDDDDESATNTKTLYVSPAEPAGPSASFTASPTSGTSPLTVYVDAGASAYDAGIISQYEWDWGDGSKGYGKTASHSYFTTGSRSYTITLTVRGTDGKTGTNTKTINVTVAGDGTTPSVDAPSARFDILDDAVAGSAGSVGVAPFKAWFDPADSEAAEGRTLASFVWSFGDGDSAFDVDADVVDHVFTTREPSEVFSVNLLVLDNESASDSITKTVKVYNHQPVAGFEIGDPAEGHIDGAAAADVHFPNNTLPIDDDHWHADDITYGNLKSLGAGTQTVSVVIRSKQITDADWFNLNGAADQDDLMKAEGVLATSSTIPVPDNYDDNEYSYDPEGQTWNGGVAPDWFPNQGWGIQWLYVDWGLGEGPEEQIAYADAADTNIWHDYHFNGTATSKVITVRAVDYLGAEDTFSRTVYFRAGVEGEDESD